MRKAKAHRSSRKAVSRTRHSARKSGPHRRASIFEHWLAARPMYGLISPHM
jgi:hypothetical protein